MKNIRSFDVFDTLIGRKCFEPDGVFDEVGTIARFPNFKTKRKLAEKNTKVKTFDGIYQSFKLISGCSQENLDKLKNLELEVESKNMFPICQNMNKVKNGDILVSDTYFNSNIIRNFLDKLGFNKNVEIYTSYGGKNSGWIWDMLKNKYKIIYHIGDNLHSDVKHPKKYGLKTIHFNSLPNSLEERIKSSGGDELSKIMRFLRLYNPYYGTNKGIYWEQQAQFNLPILIGASYVLNKKCRENNYKKLLFVTRDGTHWKNIYAKIFDLEPFTFHTSRYMLRSNNAEYEEYFKQIYTNQSIMIELYSNAKYYKRFSRKLNMLFNFFTLITKNNTSLSPIQYFIKEIPDLGRKLEMLNYDLVGVMTDYRNNKVIRGKLEYNYNLVKAGHECIQLALEMIDAKNTLFIENKDNLINYLCSELIKAPKIKGLSHTQNHFIKTPPEIKIL